MFHDESVTVCIVVPHGPHAGDPEREVQRIQAETEALPPRRRGRLLQALRKDRKAQVGLAVLALFVIGMAFASLISPTGSIVQLLFGSLTVGRWVCRGEGRDADHTA